MSSALKKHGYSASGSQSKRREAIKAALKEDSDSVIKELEAMKGKNAEDDLKYAKLLVMLAKGRAKRDSNKKGGKSKRGSRKSRSRKSRGGRSKSRRSYGKGNSKRGGKRSQSRKSRSKRSSSRRSRK